MFWGYKVFKPLVWAHRGFSAELPENGLEAFQQAYRVGAHGIECDVHVTRDGVVVITHDGSILVDNRPTSICDLNWEELRVLSRGSFIRFEDLTQLPDQGLINIELKEQGTLNGLLVDSVTGLIRRYQWQNRVVFSSFSRALLDLLNQRMTGRSLAALWASRLPAADEFRDLLPFVDGVHVLASYLTRKSLQAFQAAGYSVVIWDVTAQPELDRWIDAGVNGVIIDNPLWAAQGR